MSRVLLVVGCGGMGIAVARRLGHGTTVIVADTNEPALQAAERDLTAEGYEVTTCASTWRMPPLWPTWRNLRPSTARSGAWSTPPVCHPCSPTRTEYSPTTSLARLTTSTSLPKPPPRGRRSIHCLHGRDHETLDPGFERQLALAPTEQLLTIPQVQAVADGGKAYGLAKRANQLRFRAAANSWGKRGCRVNSISPGLISTPMGQAELAGSSGDMIRRTPADIAAATEFLLGPEASFITGADLLVDGVSARQCWEETVSSDIAPPSVEVKLSQRGGLLRLAAGVPIADTPSRHSNMPHEQRRGAYQGRRTSKKSAAVQPTYAQTATTRCHILQVRITSPRRPYSTGALRCQTR
jgi:NAD(P)-dependent dehydrogenase (short-subunit alcohol dehydrogenase family)